MLQILHKACLWHHESKEHWKVCPIPPALNPNNQPPEQVSSVLSDAEAGEGGGEWEEEGFSRGGVGWNKGESEPGGHRISGGGFPHIRSLFPG